MTDNVNRFGNVNIFPPVIFGALHVTTVLSTEEVKRAIEGSGKDFGKSSEDCEVTQFTG
jgi:hypothetical protein